MAIEKVTDPSKIVTDTLVLQQLAEQGIDPEFVEFWHDYGPRSRGKEYSPYAKFYRDLKLGKHIMVVSGLPMVKALGKKIDVGWLYAKGRYYSKANLFSAIVEGNQIQVTCLSDQPSGTKKGDSVAWSPQLFLDGKEVVGSTPYLLPVDPINPNYLENTIEWDYGICRRRLRTIEGALLGTWVFAKKPSGDIRVRYNQSGDFTLNLGQFAISGDEESITLKQFDELELLDGYPVAIGDSGTFYPDTDGAGIDGFVRRVNTVTPESWAAIRANAGTHPSSGVGNMYVARFWSQQNDADGWYDLARGITVFPSINFLPRAFVTATTLTLYGHSKTDELSATPNTNVYSANPASEDEIVAADYGTLGVDAYCDTPIEYADWEVGDPGNPNVFAFNASPGLVAVQAAVDGDGFLRLGMRCANYDVSGVEPARGVGLGSNLLAHWSGDGVGYKPKLVVTYIILTDAVWDFFTWA